MASSRIDIGGLARACARLGDVVIDPRLWVDVMDDVCAAVGAAGAGLLQGDVRTTDVPITAGARDVFSGYFRNGLHKADTRAIRGLPLVARGANILIDQELVSLEEMKRDPLYANLMASGFQWFGGVIFHAGPAIWCLSIQRKIKEGAFHPADKRLLETLCRPLSEAATLSEAVGRALLAGVGNALGTVHQPAVAIDRHGKVLDANNHAIDLFGPGLHVRGRNLIIPDPKASQRLNDVVSKMTYSSDVGLEIEPIVVRRKGQSPVVVYVLPIPPAARSPFLGARAILTLKAIDVAREPSGCLLKALFGLSPAEARLASLLAQGVSVNTAAKRLGIRAATARNQLKAVFAKTDTHRQAELVALLARL